MAAKLSVYLAFHSIESIKKQLKITPEIWNGNILNMYLQNVQEAFLFQLKVKGKVVPVFN
jgi:hypothetical protein